MITCDAVALSTVKVTGMQAGELFAHSGGESDFLAMVVESENSERPFITWLQLTGKNRFLLNALEGASYRINAFNVLRLGISLQELQVQIDETSIRRTATAPEPGCLLIGDQPCIVTKFATQPDQYIDEVYGISLRDLSRNYLEPKGHFCDRWRLVRAHDGLPPEVIAEFSPARPATGESLRI